MRCLCCDKEMINPTEYEADCQWHSKCIKKFYGTTVLPEIDINQTEQSILHLNINMYIPHQILNQNHAIKMINLTKILMMLHFYIIYHYHSSQNLYITHLISLYSIIKFL